MITSTTVYMWLKYVSYRHIYPVANAGDRRGSLAPRKNLQFKFNVCSWMSLKLFPPDSDHARSTNPLAGLGKGKRWKGRREKRWEKWEREGKREGRGRVTWGKGRGNIFGPFIFFLRKPLYLPLHYLTICQHYCLVFVNHMFAVFKNLIYIFSFECMANSAGSLFSFWMRCSVAQLVYTDTS